MIFVVTILAMLISAFNGEGAKALTAGLNRVGCEQIGDAMNQGGLFTRDYLTYGVKDTAAWKALSEAQVESIATDLKVWFEAFPKDDKTSEARTEDDLIWKVLPRLEWTDWVRQQALSVKGDGNKPDGLMFANAEAKARADKRISYEKYEEGACVVESKKWNFPLDRAGKSKNETEAPSSQMLRYLQRLEDLTKAKLRWGILTNGRMWRLYFKGAKSVAEGYCELDLADILGIEGHSLPLTSAEDRAHWLKVFILVFRRESFLRIDGKSSFHEISLEKGKFYEESVAKDLSKVVFEDVFPDLVKAIARHDPKAPEILNADYLVEVKEGALILLYRLLFVLYAEDRNLLPVEDQRYDDYGLRKKVRNDIADRLDKNDVFSDSRTSYWSQTKGLFKGIAKGDKSIGLPPYNGGLFDETETPILARVELPDDGFAAIIDKLCRVNRDGKRRYINYRDLSVQQLGSIYERLLEHEVVDGEHGLEVGLNKFARKGSGSYYTPDELVRLIIERTVGPLLKERMATFTASAAKLKGKALEALDPATAILELKVCDPAMGSGHFLVDLVDYLADAVIDATVAAKEVAEDYTSPLMGRIASIRAQIMEQASANKWAMKEDQLVDKVIVRRMVLKRVIYGVDKNPMAVELAKVALWLHSFTVGAPLSFLDHHLRCGDSLFGESVRGVLDKLHAEGGFFVQPAIQRAQASTKGMEQIELNTDADIAGVKNSAAIFATVSEAINPLSNLMGLLHAAEWQGRLDKVDTQAIQAWLAGNFGDPFDIAEGKISPKASKTGKEARKGLALESDVVDRLVMILNEGRQLVCSEKFLHWEVAFPGVWADWQSSEPAGGFDAIIGNPPWDKIKLQEVEWFEARNDEIANAKPASRRKGMIAELKAKQPRLAQQFEIASGHAENMRRVAKSGGSYSKLVKGDINIYSLFVEKALSLIKRDGIVGLLTPTGIAADKTSSSFFRTISTTSRLCCLFDFENRKVFFPAVHASFKFCAIVFAGERRKFEKTDCAFYVHNVSELQSANRVFELTGADFDLVNPNTGTTPIFRTARDAELTKQVYANVPILSNHAKSKTPIWPVRYSTMFHMTSDSSHFKDKKKLGTLGAYPIANGIWKKGNTEYVPLYVGRMIHQFDHRASSVETNEENLHNQALSDEVTIEQKGDPNFAPEPQFWVERSELKWPDGLDWAIGFRDIARATDVRTMIAAIVPRVAFGNKLPLLLPNGSIEKYKEISPLLVTNLNSLALDYTARQKVQSTSMNWFIVEQLPVIPPAAYTRRFGKESAAEIVKTEVLALTYTAHDMEPFARDMGYDGAPFAWDEMDRLKRRAKLDALYFILYGITNRDDVAYIYSTFPIVEEKEMEAHKRYLSRDYCLMYMNALEAGDPDANIQL